VAHIGRFADARDAAQAGVAAWVHGVYAETLDEPDVRELAGFGIPMAPTLVAFESYALVNDFARVATPLEREIAPAELLQAFNEPPEDLAPYDSFQPFLRLLREQRQVGRANVRRLHEAGVVILAGSDTQSGVIPGAGLHRELALLVEAGLTPAEALRAATLDPARFLEQTEDPDVGQVREGKRADLLLVEGDPTRDIAAASRIRAVIQAGVRVERYAIGTAPPSGARSRAPSGPRRARSARSSGTSGPASQGSGRARRERGYLVPAGRGPCAGGEARRPCTDSSSRCSRPCSSERRRRPARCSSAT